MNAKIISFMNMKGGVGKTTLCVNLAYSIAVLEKKTVLVIDLDPQSNTSQYMLGKDRFKELIDNEKTLYSIYRGSFDAVNYSAVGGIEEEEKEIETEDIVQNIFEGLCLVPGDIRLVRISQGVDPSVVNILGNFLERNRICNDYDFIFIDCPPTQSIYTSSAMGISSHYVLPVKPDFLSSIGIDIMKNIVKNHNRTAPRKIQCLGIIFNMVHKNAYDRDKMQEIKTKNLTQVFENYINSNSKVAEAPENQEYLLNVRGNIGAIKKITKEFIEKIGG